MCPCPTDEIAPHDREEVNSGFLIKGYPASTVDFD
jgi:hypothetical protein